MRKNYKWLAWGMSAAMLVATLPTMNNDAAAAAKIRLSATKLTLKTGSRKTIKLVNAKKKVKWKVTSGAKYITLKAKKNIAVITGKKKGKAKVQAVLGKKKYTCTVTVKNAKTDSSQTAATKVPDVYMTPAAVKTMAPAPVAPSTIQPSGSPASSVTPVPVLGNDTAVPSASVKPGESMTTPSASVKPGESTSASSVPAKPEESTLVPSVSVKPGESTPIPNASVKPGDTTETPVPTASESAVPGEVQTMVFDGTNGEEISNASGPINLIVKEGVKELDERQFVGNTNIVSVSLPDSLECIDHYALAYSNITTITIPKNVKDLTYPFQGCPKLKEIIVAKDNPYYDSRDNCNAVIETATNTLVAGCGETVIPEGIKTIGWKAFNGCPTVKNIILPDSVTSILEYAFACCDNLESVNLPAGLTDIGKEAFCWCEKLQSITIPEGVTRIGENAFLHCGSVKSIEIPSSVTEIERGAFAGNKNLESLKVSADNPKYDSRDNSNAIIDTETNTLVTACEHTVIPDSVERIGSYAFANVELEKYTIPKTIKELEERSFAESKIDTIELSGGIESLSGQVFSGSEVKQIILSEGLKSIGWGVFSQCNELKSVILPDSLTSMESSVFKDCTSLEEVHFGSGLTTIGNYAFSECSSLTKIEIGEGVTRIGQDAFKDCTGLTSVLIPASVRELGTYYSGSHFVSNPFAGCDALSEIKVAEENPIYDSRDNCNAVITTAGNELVLGTKSTVIPASVTSIGQKAFQNCTGLTKLEIPDTVTYIDWYAFDGCTGLTEIKLPNSIQKIQSCTFKDCTGLTKLEIPESVTLIAGGAFEGCTGLTELTIPASVTKMDTEDGTGYFNGCTNLKSLKVAEDNPVYDSRDNCNGIIETATNTLVCAYENTTIPDSVKVIGYGAFSELDVTDITIPAGVTELARYAIAYCDSLTSVTIPDSVEKIGMNVFIKCSQLNEIHWNGKTYSDAETFLEEFHAAKGDQ